MARTYPLQQKRESHAAANAECGESEFDLSLLHFVKQRRGNANTSAADRMAQRDRATVDVQTITRETELAIASDHLRRESFVQLDQIDVGKRKLLSLQQRAHGWDWTNAHDLGRDSADLVIDDARLRRGSEPVDSVFAQHDDCRCAISNAR